MGRFLGRDFLFNSKVLGLLSVLASKSTPVSMTSLAIKEKSKTTRNIFYLIKSFTDKVWQFFYPRQFRLLLVIINSVEASDISSSAKHYFDTLHKMSSSMHQLVINFIFIILLI